MESRAGNPWEIIKIFWLIHIPVIPHPNKCPISFSRICNLIQFINCTLVIVRKLYYHIKAIEISFLISSENDCYLIISFHRYCQTPEAEKQQHLKDPPLEALKTVTKNNELEAINLLLITTFRVRFIEDRFLKTIRTADYTSPRRALNQ
jgi:hypothetical protein